MQTRPDNPTIRSRLTLIVGLAIWCMADSAQGFRSTGPGTQGPGVPQPFSVQDFDSVRRNNFPFPSNMSPGVLHALGGCVDPDGNPPKSPIEYDLSLRTEEDISIPWSPGEMREISLVLRSSSLRWVKTPPRIDLILIGGDGRDLLIGGDGADYEKGSALAPFAPTAMEVKGIADGTSNTILFTVPDVPAGLYRFHVFERTTGICKASDLTFRISDEGSGETPTPTPTGDVTPTPTQTPDGPTPTRTFRRPDYNDDQFVNAQDYPEFLQRLIVRNEEADLDGEDAESFRDLFMFSLWWQNDRLPE